MNNPIRSVTALAVLEGQAEQRRADYTREGPNSIPDRQSVNVQLFQAELFFPDC